MSLARVPSGECHGCSRVLDARDGHCIDCGEINPRVVVNNGDQCRRLLAEWQGGEYCSACGISPTWNGQPLTLQINHRDGNRHNNELWNLEFLCPNCHTQTETYAGRRPRGQRVPSKQPETARLPNYRGPEARRNYRLAAQRRDPAVYRKMVETRNAHYAEAGRPLNGRRTHATSSL